LSKRTAEIDALLGIFNGEYSLLTEVFVFQKLSFVYTITFTIGLIISSGREKNPIVDVK